MHEQVVFVRGQPRRVESAKSGTWWEYSSKDVQTAWKWNESIQCKGQDKVIKAIQVQSTNEGWGAALDLTSISANKGWRIGTVATRYNMDNAVVLLSEENQHVAAEIEVRQGPYEHERLKAWADRVIEGSKYNDALEVSRA